MRSCPHLWIISLFPFHIYTIRLKAFLLNFLLLPVTELVLTRWSYWLFLDQTALFAQIEWARLVRKGLSLTLAGVAQWIEWWPETKGSLVRFPLRAHAWVAGQVRSMRAHERQPHIDVSLPLFLPPFPSFLDKWKEKKRKSPSMDTLLGPHSALGHPYSMPLLQSLSQSVIQKTCIKYRHYIRPWACRNKQNRVWGSTCLLYTSDAADDYLEV